MMAKYSIEFIVFFLSRLSQLILFAFSHFSDEARGQAPLINRINYSSKRQIRNYVENLIKSCVPLVLVYQGSLLRKAGCKGNVSRKGCRFKINHLQIIRLLTMSTDNWNRILFSTNKVFT